MTDRKHLWETHLHTAEGSACAGTPAAEMARAHHQAGYEGIVVTDHFFNGNTAVPAGLPWKERWHSSAWATKTPGGKAKNWD
jgi:histidinol phosphatase-like PHP family hydrolase